MTFDLASLDTKKASETGAVLNLKHPATLRPLKDESNKYIFFKVIGKHSEAYIKAQNRLQNVKLKEMRGRGPQTTIEEMEDDGIGLLSVAITGWSDNFTVDGKKLEFTPANVRMVLSDPRLRWIREQVDGFVGDIANFLAE